MRRSRIFKLLMLGALVAGLLVAVAAVSAFHPWNGYHWKGDNLTPKVADRTSSSLYDVPAAVNEWAALATPIQPRTGKGKNGNVVAAEGYSPDWLGLAQIYVDADGHISKGRVILNTILLGPYGPFVADHVACQEFGHVWGLEHNRIETNTCMNDAGNATTPAEWLAILNAPGSDSPNQHDIDQLNTIYAHSLTEAGGDGKPKPCKGKKCSSTSGWVTVHVFAVPDFD